VRPGGVLGQHGADDDLAGGDRKLAVVPGHVAFLVPHHPHVGVGDVRPGLGAGPVGARFIARAAPTAPFPGCRGLVPGFLLGPLRVAAGLVLGRQPAGGGGQPLPPSGPPRQRPRRRLARRVAVAGILRGVGRGRLGQQLADLRQRPVRLLRRVAGQLGAIQADRAQ
jgi:hypothetical protein